MKKIVVAPQAFKETLSAWDTAHAMMLEKLCPKLKL